MGSGIIGMRGTQNSKKAEGFFLDRSFRVVGGVVEAVEEHRDSIRGEGLYDFVEIFEGDVVGVSIR